MGAGTKVKRVCYSDIARRERQLLIRTAQFRVITVKIRVFNQSAESKSKGFRLLIFGKSFLREIKSNWVTVSSYL